MKNITEIRKLMFDKREEIGYSLEQIECAILAVINSGNGYMNSVSRNGYLKKETKEELQRLGYSVTIFDNYCTQEPRFIIKWDWSDASFEEDIK